MYFLSNILLQNLRLLHASFVPPFLRSFVHFTVSVCV